MTLSVQRDEDRLRELKEAATTRVEIYDGGPALVSIEVAELLSLISALEEARAKIKTIDGIANSDYSSWERVASIAFETETFLTSPIGNPSNHDTGGET
jgi:hypothetical protein